mmetsp:Transcript_100689/g.290984  ORF Transcript_100689/g.290984 Transcript_100689/m.290984 type:complete len:397 (+) Transcript_100689:51-1241(+)
MLWSAWCCQVSEQEARMCEVAAAGTEGHDMPLGLPQSFATLGEGQEPDTIRFEVAFTSDEKKTASKRRTTMCTSEADGKAPPPAAHGAVPTLLPRVGEKTTYHTPRKRTELHTSRSSRVSVSTVLGSNTEDDDDDDQTASEADDVRWDAKTSRTMSRCGNCSGCRSGLANATSSASTNSVSTMACSSVATTSCATSRSEAQEPQMILYPWEKEEAMWQARRDEGCSRSSSPRFVGAEQSILRWRDQADDPAKAKMFQVELARSDGKKLGLDTRPLVSTVTGALSVERVRSGGLVAEYNQAVHDAAAQGGARRRRIRRGDFIIEVNGVSGSSDGMYKVIASEQHLRLLVMRMPGSRATEGRASEGRRPKGGSRSTGGGEQSAGSAEKATKAQFASAR